MTLDSPVTDLKGIGLVLSQKLALLKISTVGDLIYNFPRKYVDFSNVVKIVDVAPGQVTIKASVESTSAKYMRRGLHLTEAILDDGTAKTRAIWFNQPYRQNQFKAGEIYVFSGNYELQRNRYILSSPAVASESDFSANTGRIVPIYSETQGLKSAQLRRALGKAWPLIAVLPESLPASLVTEQKLVSLSMALQEIHFPQNTQSLEVARKRLAFEELLAAVIASQINKRETQKVPGYKIDLNVDYAKQFIGNLKFKLTDAQRRSAWEILKDISSGVPMNRLLQGDVGSGKTVVAAMVAFMACKQGYQVALMAPTEILAAQHAQTMANLLEPQGLTVALLTGSVKTSQRNILQVKLASGVVDVAVGTHALLQKDSQFAQLGLVIIDEQHRFGVDQRAELLKKSQLLPHLLSMTATPIPRSLQLTVYGELEVSVIDELPAGRQVIKTSLHSPFERQDIYANIEQQLAYGRQAYVVCPLVEMNDQSELKSVQTELDSLQQKFSGRRLAALHGQLKSEEKDRIMQEFQSGAIDILVATTVIEVGVDIPNATVMLIEGAERFGLAQLHQLRGRVGRGAQQSYCYLIPSSGKKPSERLRELEKSQDGFYLAEVDLKLRGPGEIYGRMQHGALDFKIANITDTKLVAQVQKAAVKLLDSGEDLLQYKQLYDRLTRYRGITSLN